MSLAEENYLWILKHQILPNQYGLKRVALLKAIAVLEGATPLAASSSPAEWRIEKREVSSSPADDFEWVLIRRNVLVARIFTQGDAEDMLSRLQSASSPAWEPIRALTVKWRALSMVRTGDKATHMFNQAFVLCAEELEALLPPAPKEPT